MSNSEILVKKLVTLFYCKTLCSEFGMSLKDVPIASSFI